MPVTVPRVVVLGDLVADLVLLPERPLRRGTDVTGRVVVRQGGSAATTARVLASLDVRSTLVTAIGADRAGKSLVALLETAGVEVRAPRIRSAATGRLGVLVEASGERTFVADRGAILRLRPGHLRAAWLRGVALLHLPAYSLFGEGLAEASERAVALARASGASVSVDLASAGFLEDFGVGSVLERVRRIAPDVLFANEAERAAAGRLAGLAPLVVVKRGGSGAAALCAGKPPLDVAVPKARVRDSTGAGDAFDAGFLAAWLRGGARTDAIALRAAIGAGHAAARREVTARRPELDLGELVPLPAARR